MRTQEMRKGRTETAVSSFQAAKQFFCGLYFFTGDNSPRADIAYCIVPVRRDTGVPSAADEAKALRAGVGGGAATVRRHAQKRREKKNEYSKKTNLSGDRRVRVPVERGAVWRFFRDHPRARGRYTRKHCDRTGAGKMDILRRHARHGAIGRVDRRDGALLGRFERGTGGRRVYARRRVYRHGDAVGRK